jgi:hypothetical protein
MGRTALQFRRDAEAVLRSRLKDGASKAATPPVFIYNTARTTGTV